MDTCEGLIVGLSRMHDEACWLPVYLSSLSPANTQLITIAKEGPALISDSQAGAVAGQDRAGDIRETLERGDHLDSFCFWK